jgi:hypothetical protein
MVRPLIFLIAHETKTGSFPIILTMAWYISSSESTFTEEGLKAVNALVKEESIPIG